MSAVPQWGVPVKVHIAGCITAWSLRRLLQNFISFLPLLDLLVHLCSCPVCELHHFVACAVVKDALIGCLRPLCIGMCCLLMQMMHAQPCITHARLDLAWHKQVKSRLLHVQRLQPISERNYAEQMLSCF